MKKIMKKLHMSGSSTSMFIEECLRCHNKYRAIHGSPRLFLSQELTTYAQEWADILAERSFFEHRPNCEYGESLFTAFENDPNWIIRPSDPVKSWYSEIELYTFDESVVPNTIETGHFTQLVWKSTRKLGVGISLHPSNRVYVVCDYDPPGNTVGEFDANVLPPVKAAKYKHTTINTTSHDTLSEWVVNSGNGRLH